MVALVAALSRCDADVVPSVITMLKALSHRGTGTCELGTPTVTGSARSHEELREHVNEPPKVAIGHHGPNAILSRGGLSRLTNDCATVVLGQVLPRSSASRHDKDLTDEKDKCEGAAERLLTNFEGAFTFAVASPRQMLIGRDQLGVMPLCYGSDMKICAVATERKALWKVGVEQAYSFPPGKLAKANRRGFTFEIASAITKPPQEKIELNAAARRLQKLLEESTLKRVCDVTRVGVAFSGGLDSSVVACLAKKCDVSVDLISVGLEGQPELAHAEKAAEALGLPIKLHAFGIREVDEALSRVLWLIEEPDVMKISVAIPFFWTAKIASKLGCHVLLAGQGADELFGGYRRYLTVYERNGAEKVAETLYHDMIFSYETNFQRDGPVCAFHKVDLRLPFVDTDVVRFALSLPVDLRIASATDGL